MNRDVARVLEQKKSCLRYGGARFMYALNTNTILLNIIFCLSRSSPKYHSFVSVVKEESHRERERERERERFMTIQFSVIFHVTFHITDKLQTIQLQLSQMIRIFL